MAGRYELRRRLGKGGFAEVWYATDRNWPLGEQVRALKFIQPLDEGDRNRIEQMCDEARVLLELTHENIVMLRDYGTHDDALPFLVLDYVAGGSLDKLLDRRAQNGRGLDADEALWVLHEIAPALTYAHDRGVVHRDIKPANVLLTAPVDGRLDSRVHAKLADFGIAIPAGLEEAVSGAGTLSFMAPESLMRRELDKEALKRADVWALGATIYCLVAGEPPFRAASSAELIRLITTADAPALQSGDPMLDAAVQRALSRDLQVRWPSAAVFARKAGVQRDTITLGSIGGLLARPKPVADIQLYVRRAPPFPPDQNAVLQVGIANPGSEAVEGRLFFEPADALRLAVPEADRGFELRGREARWIHVAIRPAEPGQQRLPIRVLAKCQGGPVSLVSVEGEMSIVTGAARGEGVLPTGVVEPGAARAEDDYGQVLADAVRCSIRDLRRVPLARTPLACGVAPSREGQVNGTIRVDIRREGRLVRRVYVVARTKAWFGRAPEPPEGRNDIALLELPCRSAAQDPGVWQRNLEISRRAGYVLANDKGSYVHAASRSIVFDGSALAVGETVYLRAGTRHRMLLGGLELTIQAHRAAGSDRSLPRLLADRPLQSALASSGSVAPARHHSIHVRRVGNLDDIEYALACPWLAFGGDPTNDIVVGGLPTEALVLGHRGGDMFALIRAVDAVPGDKWLPGQGVWIPVVSGDTIEFGRFQVELAATSTSAMTADGAGEERA